MTDHYADGTCQWWHLSRPAPELIAALGDGWLTPGGRVLDVGCGLGTEAGYLASAGWRRGDAQSACSSTRVVVVVTAPPSPR